MYKNKAQRFQGITKALFIDPIHIPLTIDLMRNELRETL